MANRDVTNYRSVTQVVPEQQSNYFEPIKQGIEQLHTLSQEALMNKNLSEAQLKLGQLQNDFMTKYQSDPAKGVAEYKAARDNVISSYDDGVSPMFRLQWNESQRQLKARDDLAMQQWQFKQTNANTINNINDAMALNLAQADLNGQAFGSGKITELKSALDYQANYNKIFQTGAGVIGVESTKKQMDGFKNKYISDFIGGVASVNSEKAKELLDDDRISGALTSGEKQNIMSKIIRTEGIEQDLKVDEYKNKADEAFSKDPYSFIDEARSISKYGDEFRASQGLNRKAFDQILSYNNQLIERHKTNSYIDFYKNPSKEGLDYLQKLKPEMTDTEKERLTDIYETTPNYEMTTTFSGYEGALMDIQKLSLMPNETSKQKDEILKKSIDIVHKMKRSNLGATDKASTLSRDDINELSKTMYKAVDDSLFKKELADMPDISIFNKIYKNVIEPFVNDKLVSTTYDNYNRARNIEKTGYITASEMIKALMNGDVELSRRTYQEGLEKAIKQKYYYLPEMQGKLEPDKTTFKINGKPYVFKGFGSEDIILEKLD